MKELILAFFLVMAHPSDFTILDSIYDMSYVDEYYRAVSYVPDNMMNCIEADGWKVRVIDDLEKYNAYANGLCIPDEKLLLIDPAKCKRDGFSTEYVIIHELCHAFDHQKDMPSSMIYDKHEEVFANSLANYLMGYPTLGEHKVFFEFLLNK